MCVCALSASTSIHAATVNGFVADDTNGESVPFAAISLHDGTIGTIGNASGYFALKGVATGTIVIVASHVGYKNWRDTVQVREDAEIRLSIRLQPQVIVLQEETVISAERLDDERIVQPSLIALAPRQLGYMPAVATPVANYVPYVRSGNLLFLAGQISRGPDGAPLVGKLGDTLTVEQGYEAARSAALSAIAVMKAALDDLERIARVVRVTALVNATPEFESQSQVANGASDLFVAVFDERGRHARTAAGMSSLPLGTAVEIEVTVEVTA